MRRNILLAYVAAPEVPADPEPATQQQQSTLGELHGSPIHTQPACAHVKHIGAIGPAMPSVPGPDFGAATEVGADFSDAERNSDTQPAGGSYSTSQLCLLYRICLTCTLNASANVAHICLNCMWPVLAVRVTVTIPLRSVYA